MKKQSNLGFRAKYSPMKTCQSKNSSWVVINNCLMFLFFFSDKPTLSWLLSYPGKDKCEKKVFSDSSSSSLHENCSWRLLTHHNLWPKLSAVKSLCGQCRQRRRGRMGPINKRRHFFLKKVEALRSFSSVSARIVLVLWPQCLTMHGLVLNEISKNKKQKQKLELAFIWICVSFRFYLTPL